MFGRILDWVVRYGILSKGILVMCDIFLICVFYFVGVYGFGGKYYGFVGKDVLRVMVKWFMEEEDLNDDLVSKNIFINELIVNVKKL